MTQLMLNEPLVNDRPQMVNLVRQWGDVNTDGLLESSCKTFAIQAVEGFIGYRVESSNAVVFGDPVCAEEDKPTLAMAFQEYCNSHKLGVVYTIVSEAFSNWASQHLNAVSIEFGEKYVLDPFHNPTNNTGSKAVLVRKKVKHATSLGVIVKEYTTPDPSIETQIEQVAASWVQKRNGPQIYLSHVTLFNDREGKRWFYAEYQGKIVGLLLLNQLKSKEGWLLNNVMMLKDAPKGLSELLVISTLQALEKEGCHYVLVGPIPGKQLGEIKGIGEIPATVTRWLYKGAKMIFHLEGHAAFWDKFQPKSEGSYVLFPQQNLGYSSIKALLRAFNVTI